MNTARAASIILAKELRSEFRSRDLLITTVVFALLVVVLFSFAFDPTTAESRRFGPGLLWIAFLFAGSLMLHPSFGREHANDTLYALRMAPIDPFAILLGKMLANFVFLLFAELLLLPVFSVLYNVDLLPVIGRLILVLILGTLGISHHRHCFFRRGCAGANARIAPAAASASNSHSGPDRGRRGHRRPVG